MTERGGRAVPGRSDAGVGALLAAHATLLPVYSDACDPGPDDAAEEPSAAGRTRPEPPAHRVPPVTRVTVTGDGPVLITGPVDIELPDGRRVCSRRAVTALCVCRRTRRPPFCDTSHRERVRGRADED